MVANKVSLETDDCKLVANNVVLFAVNVSLKVIIVAINLRPKLR
jgi:hypothetical protein